MRITWLDWVNNTVYRAKLKSKSNDELVENCKLMGLPVSNKDVFLRTYGFRK